MRTVTSIPAAPHSAGPCGLHQTCSRSAVGAQATENTPAYSPGMVRRASLFMAATMQMPLKTAWSTRSQNDIAQSSLAVDMLRLMTRTSFSIHQSSPWAKLRAGAFQVVAQHSHADEVHLWG